MQVMVCKPKKRLSYSERNIILVSVTINLTT